jgi:catechol 2,3-dioxygenase-like lactoylglutathione lyase family enzyme
MKPRITIITIGVDDLDRSLRFYRDGLGFPTRGIVGTEYEHGAVAFFDLTHGQKLAIWARRDLAHEAKVPLGPRSATEFSLGHNVGSKAEVDAVIGQAHRAGATITDPPHEAFWGGYTGSFQDPDGHLWEVAWNPEMNPPEQSTAG